LIKIGSVSWDEFQADLTTVFFHGIKPGEVVPIVVERNGQIVQVAWMYPGFNQAEFIEQFISEWGIAYIFWLAGLLTVLHVRPRDTRWLLMAAFYFLTAIWMIAGSGVSAYHIWLSGLLLRVVIWLCVPIYLHFHWLFPQPLGTLPPLLVKVIYAVALILAVAQGYQLFSSSLYLFGFLIAIGGSLVLLWLHYWRQPSARRELRLLFVAAVLALVFPLVWGAVFLFTQIPSWLGGLSLISLPLLPMAYLYTVYRRQLRGLELRVNRFISIYIFLIFLITMGLALVALMDSVSTFPQKNWAIGSVVCLFSSAMGIWGYPAFQAYMETRILGIPLPSKQLLERYSTHITNSASILDLTRILHNEILSSLLVRQFAFLFVDHGNLKVLSIMNVAEDQLPNNRDVPNLQTQSGNYLHPALGINAPLEWIRLIIPLKLGDQIICFWLFGRRDPDDLYAQAEIPILQSLANQTAVAVSNILQTGHIKSMYEANILRHEEERLRLARDLHDSVLNELAALVISDDAPVLSPKIQLIYETVTQRLREIVSDLRPPMLNFGLKLALEGLADNLMERAHDSTQLVADITASGECRYSETVEINLYRIAQEACENSLRYAHAQTIQIIGTLSPGRIDIIIEDDGIGFATEISLKLNDMSANKHFGLLNMLERANLIGAEIKIDSKPGQGTKVSVMWMSR
jgi:signal transduction histidine kinase